MKKYTTPNLELQLISTTDIMTGSGNTPTSFAGLFEGESNYVGNSLDFSNF